MIMIIRVAAMLCFLLLLLLLLLFLFLWLRSKVVQVRWFAYNRVWHEAKSVYVQIPDGDICWTDGATAETFPNYKDKKELLNEILTNSEMKSEFDLTRKGVVAAEVHFIRRPEYVRSTTTVGRRIVRKLAFVTETEFKRVFKIELGTPGLNAKRVDGMPTYEGGEGEPGTLLEIKNLPPDLNFEVVELYSQNVREHFVELLGPTLTFRSAQPLERFSLAVDTLCGSRPQLMRGAPGEAHDFLRLKKEAKTINKALLTENVVATQNQGIGREMVATSSTTLADVGDGIVIGKRRAAEKASSVLLAKRKLSGAPAPSFAKSAAAARQAAAKPKDGGKKRRHNHERVMSEVASALNSEQSASGLRTPSASPPTTPLKGHVVKHVASVLNLDCSDVEDEQGGIDIQAILLGRKLGRSVRSVFCLSVSNVNVCCFFCVDN